MNLLLVNRGPDTLYIFIEDFELYYTTIKELQHEI